eukprot:COSAG02_NODE_75_length_41389_cov_106.665762_38_plen_132_part_00
MLKLTDYALRLLLCPQPPFLGTQRQSIDGSDGSYTPQFERPCLRAGFKNRTIVGESHRRMAADCKTFCITQIPQAVGCTSDGFVCLSLRLVLCCHRLCVVVAFSIDRLNANEMERLTEAELEEARKPLADH